MASFISTRKLWISSFCILQITSPVHCFQQGCLVGKSYGALVTKRWSNFGASDDEAEDESNDEQSLNSERERLEASILGSSSFSTSKNNLDKSSSTKRLIEDWKKQLQNPPPLTAIGRERASTEIALLESLSDSDDAISNLWDLWYNSRGPSAAKKLEETDAYFSQGGSENYDVAEKKLRHLIVDEDIYFVEAVNRLATVLYLQKRFEESKELCKIVLAVKPWHFGALSGIVLVCRGLQDAEGMMHWAGQRMPPLDADAGGVSFIGKDGIKTRKEWVFRMVEMARKRQRIAKKELKESFRDLDKSRNNGDGVIVEDSDLNWQ